MRSLMPAPIVVRSLIAIAIVLLFFGSARLVDGLLFCLWLSAGLGFALGFVHPARR